MWNYGNGGQEVPEFEPVPIIGVLVSVRAQPRDRLRAYERQQRTTD